MDRSRIPLGQQTVAYEAVTVSPLMDFPEGHWRSNPDRETMIREFKESGLHPFDVLELRPPDVVVVDHRRSSGGKNDQER